LLSHFLTSIMEETPVVQPHQVRYQVRMSTTAAVRAAFPGHV